MPLSDPTKIIQSEIHRVVSLLRANKKREAIDHSLSLSEKFPTSVPIIQLLSNTYISIGDYKSAIQQYSKLLSTDPHNPIILKNLGAMHLKNDQPQNAIYTYKKILDFAPNDAEVHYKIGNAYFENSDFTLAIRYYKNALNLDPNFFEALYNLGNTYLTLKDFNKAEDLFNKCLIINSNHTGLLGNLGIVFLESGEVEKAINIFKNLIDICPSPIAKEYLGRALLLKGRFQSGWKYYEARLDVADKYPVFLQQKARPLWDGEEGKDVFISLEQGIGDQIMFMSLAEEAQIRCRSLTILVDKRIKSICERSMPSIKFISSKEQIDNIDFDYQLPIGSLPRLFRNNEIDFQKSRVGYLKADQNYVNHLKKKLNLANRPLVGLSWASFDCLTSDKKSIELNRLREALNSFGCDVINLQYGNVKRDVEEFSNNINFKFINDHGIDVYDDIEGLAALIEICDLVVTIPNITIQLTGALGKEGWVLLPFSPNYPWTDYRKTSLWYKNIDIFRQKKINDWTEVLAELEEMASKFFK